jgi:cytochrome c nitrite reductase small subunit
MRQHVKHVKRHVKQNLGRAMILLAVIAGTFAGLGLYTFSYGEGFSYFSTDPAACANCHIMRDEYDSWQKSTHHTASTCVECHLPHEFIPKYLAKADHGYRHSKAFTFGGFHEPIQITPRDRVIVQENCVRCHADLVHALTAGSTTDEDAVQCINCHRGVGHSARYGH